MGLTIHYDLQTHLTALDDIRELVESLRQVARGLPFKEVSELLEFQGEDADYEQGAKEDEHRWLKIQARNYDQYTVKPLHIIGFSTWPGEGCESANFGFCKYPSAIEIPTSAGRTRKVATRLKAWCCAARRSTPRLLTAVASRTSFAAISAW